MARFACDSSGTRGVVPAGHTSDQMLCPTCGEPVWPDD